jgi:hypothetical protein
VSTLKAHHWLVDQRVRALNVSLSIEVEEYLQLLEDIIDANELQRNKVRSHNPRVLLKSDLLSGCVIPPIVLACSEAGVAGFREDIERALDSQLQTDPTVLFGKVQDVFRKHQLIILDGLQRSYALMEAAREDVPREIHERFLKRELRIELQLGLSKRGLLYRMLTLNTGQTPMTLKHQLEILYKDYEDAGRDDGIALMSEKSGKKPQRIGDFSFADAVNMYQARLTGDAAPIDRAGIVDQLQRDQILQAYDEASNEDVDTRDIFAETLICYVSFIQRIDELALNWHYEGTEINNPFGKSIFQIFVKPQPMGAFGATIGLVLDSGSKSAKIFATPDQIRRIVEQVNLPTNPAETFDQVIDLLAAVQARSKKVGEDQREFFSEWFRFIFDVEGSTYLDVAASANKAVGRAEKGLHKKR